MLIDEHAPRGTKEDDNSSDTYQPTEEEQKAIKKVDKFFSKARKYRSNYDKDWIDNYKFFRGQQWREQRPSYRHSEVINMVFSTIQSFVPILTDSRPKFEFTPQNPADQEFASILNELCEADWQKNNWLQQLTESIYDAHIYGIGYGSMLYSKKHEMTEGDIKFSSEDPLYCYPDPNAKDINDDRCYGFLIAEPVDVEILKKEYENGKYVQGDLQDLTNYDKTDIDYYARLRLPIDDTKVMRDSAGSVDTLNMKRALKKTFYVHDDSYEETQKFDEMGVPYFEQVKKYPRGRKIVVAGKVLLEDGPIEYEDGKIPYARLVNYILPREFFGVSEIEQVRGPQRVFNKLVSFALDVLTLMGNPIWVVSNDSGVDTDNLFNKPGLIVEKNPGSEVRREEGVQLQPYVLQMIDRFKTWFDDITGSADVSRGAAPGGVTAAQAISDLQEAAQTRLRLKARNIDAFLQNIGQMWVSRTLQFRDAPKIARFTDSQGVEKYFKMHVQAQLDEMGNPMMDEAGQIMKKAVVQRYNMTPEGQYVEGPIQEFDIKGAMDVKVQTGSSLPFMKSRKVADAKELFQSGVIDAEELLKTLDWPNRESVLARMQQKQMEAQAAQMQPPLPPA